jgi:hypothetical protein
MSILRYLDRMQNVTNQIFILCMYNQVFTMQNDREQLSQEFIDQIDKVKPEKKSLKKPRSISYET